MVGRVVPGILSDRLGRFNILFVVALISGILMLAFWLPLNASPTVGGTIAFGLLYGFASGGFISLMLPCVVVLADNRVEDLGAKMGMACLCVALAGLTGLPIAGAIRDRSADGSFTGLICFSGAVVVTGGLFVLATRFAVSGRKLWIKV